ncbi:MAG: hypothetical protein DHS20C05_11870 [Hyphococcus sp.]|nr:MAG: hypothetical protein DHS20C05_11870 [Marinicaulis sp.]
MEIRLLTEQEKSAVTDGLKLAAKWVSGDLPLSTAQVQDLFDAVRTDHADNTMAQIAVGLAFGETIARETGYEWVRVTDEYGDETALAPKGIEVACHPISMLQKRISRSEQTNIVELRDVTIKRVEKMVASGEYRTR